MIVFKLNVFYILLGCFLVADYFSLNSCLPVDADHDGPPDSTITSTVKRSGRCESISNPICKDIGYNETVFPNHYRHNNQNEAGYELNQFAPLVKINCSQNVKLFLCALFFPPCTIMDPPIKPCRSVCLSTKEGCESLLLQFGYPWPKDFDCSTLPEDQPCVIRDDSGSTSPDPAILRTTEEKSSASKNYLNPLATDRFHCPTNLKTPRELNYVFRLNGKFYSECGTPCDNFIFSNSTRDTVRLFILFFSVLCLISVSLTLIIYLLSQERFDFLHKALASLSLCYLLISVVYIVGFFVGDSIACNHPFPPPDHQQNLLMKRTLTQGIHKDSCTFTFMLLFFAQNASFLWFTLLCFTWFLTTFSAWGPESLDKKSGYFYAIVWGIAGISMVWHMAYKKIQGDVLSGVCFLGILDREKRYFSWDSASTVQISISMILFLLSFASSWRIRKDHKKNRRETKQMDSFIFKLTVFSVIYLCSSIILIGCYAYEEHNIDNWILAWQLRVCREPDHGIPCPLSHSMVTTPKIWFLVVKYAAQLLPGMIVILPFLSKKSFESWFEFCCKIFRCWESDHRKPSQAISLDKFSSKT